VNTGEHKMVAYVCRSCAAILLPPPPEVAFELLLAAPRLLRPPAFALQPV
jgi:hypothetical protein